MTSKKIKIGCSDIRFILIDKRNLSSVAEKRELEKGAKGSASSIKEACLPSESAEDESVVSETPKGFDNCKTIECDFGEHSKCKDSCCECGCHKVGELVVDISHDGKMETVTPKQFDNYLEKKRRKSAEVNK